MAHRQGPAWDEADNMAGSQEPLSTNGSPRATLHHGQEITISEHRPKIRMQSGTTVPNTEEDSMH